MRAAGRSRHRRRARAQGVLLAPAGWIGAGKQAAAVENGPDREAGSAIAEFAIAFPFLVLLLVFIGAVVWTFWVQAATAIATQEAARAAAYRTGDGYSPLAGYQPFAQALAGITNQASAAQVGAPQIRVDATRRSLQIVVESPISFTTPAFSADYSFRAGTFTRLMQFFGGPQDPWE